MVTRTVQGEPTTLTQAQEMADRLWPGWDAPLAAWQAFHQDRARLFESAASADPGHRHEARFLASVEREEADAVAARMTATAKNKPVDDVGPGGDVSTDER